MSLNPDISIVVPSFMHGDYLAHCLDSILEQENVAMEVFLFDNCSTDETVDVLNHYKDRIQVFVEKDLGQAHAINKGFRKCSGEVLCFLNSDDIFTEGCLEKVVAYFKSNSDVDLLYGSANYINKEGAVIGPYLTRDWSDEYLYKECFLCQPAVFWRKKVYEKIGGLEESLNYSIDYDYWLRVVISGFRIRRVDELLACSRDYPETKTRSGVNKVYWENFKLLLRRKGYVPSHWISGYFNLLLIQKNSLAEVLVPKSMKKRLLVGRLISCFSRLLAGDIHPLTEREYNRAL